MYSNLYTKSEQSLIVRINSRLDKKTSPFVRAKVKTIFMHFTKNESFFYLASKRKKKRGSRSPLFLIPIKDNYLVTVIFTVLMPSVVVTFTK
jgi:hypothetical protein